MGERSVINHNSPAGIFNYAEEHIIDVVIFSNRGLSIAVARRAHDANSMVGEVSVRPISANRMDSS